MPSTSISVGELGSGLETLLDVSLDGDSPTTGFDSDSTVNCIVSLVFLTKESISSKDFSFTAVPFTSKILSPTFKEFNSGPPSSPEIRMRWDAPF